MTNKINKSIAVEWVKIQGSISDHVEGVIVEYIDDKIWGGIADQLWDPVYFQTISNVKLPR